MFCKCKKLDVWLNSLRQTVSDFLEGKKTLQDLRNALNSWGNKK